MHVRFIDNEDDDPSGIIDLKVRRVPLPGETVVLLRAEWSVVDVTTVYDAPDGHSERYDVRLIKRMDLE